MEEVIGLMVEIGFVYVNRDYITMSGEITKEYYYNGSTIRIGENYFSFWKNKEMIAFSFTMNFEDISKTIQNAFLIELRKKKIDLILSK